MPQSRVFQKAIIKKKVRIRRSPLAIILELLPMLLSLVVAELVLFQVLPSSTLPLAETFIGLRVLVILEGLRRHYNHRWTLYNDRIQEQSGLLSLKYRESSVNYRDIREVRIQQNLIARLLGFGKVQIASASTDEYEIGILDATSPRKVSLQIQRLRRREHRESDE
jgi:uncharacterized membrane protein YdbT with pleckstrin-like domain